MDISCAFATALDTPDHIALAERLGYRRAWCYDSPGLYADVWMVLGRAAQHTSTIGLGPAVLVPSLRHPMTNAAAIATLAAWAPGRVAVAIGSGFTGRMVFGQRPMRWSDVEAYVRALRALLRGEEAEWDGARLKMLHTAHCSPPRPVDVPILIGADGPKGLAVAANVGDGVFCAGAPQADTGPLTWRALLSFGTVLDDGEAPTSPRALAAVGPALAVLYHALYERRGVGVDRLPGAPRWRESIEAARATDRHLEIHEGHLIEPNRHDQLVLEAAAPLAPTMTMTGTAAGVRERLVAIAAAGVTEIAYQPAGPDIPRELETFAAAAQGV